MGSKLIDHLIVEAKKLNIRTWRYNEDIYDFSLKIISKSIWSIKQNFYFQNPGFEGGYS